MQDRIKILNAYLNKKKSEKGAACAAYVAIDSLLTINNLRTKSELQREEECNAIAFFLAFIQIYYSSETQIRSLYPDFPELINKIIDQEQAQNTYPEMLHWGLSFLDQYEEAKKNKKLPFAILISSFEAQEFLKKVATPTIFEEDKKESSEQKEKLTYKETLRKEKTNRYKLYVEYREKFRNESIPQLRVDLKTYQSYKSWGTAACFIPGVFWLMGCKFTWEYIKQSKLGTAFIWFVGSAILSAFSPLSALYNYYLYNQKEREAQHQIDEAKADKDLIVTRTYTWDDYTNLWLYRRLLKQAQAKTLQNNPSKLFNKPKKHIERFEEKGIPKVKIFMDPEQSERLDIYQYFKIKDNQATDVSPSTAEWKTAQQMFLNNLTTSKQTFLKQLKTSKQKSIETTQALHLEYEKRFKKPS